MQKGYRYNLPVEDLAPKPPSSSNRKHWLATAAILIILSVVSAIFVRSRAVQKSPSARPQPANAIVLTPTPFQFQELTIPYLRAREYKSQLGQRTTAYQNATYTAYLTSYESDGLRINGLLTEPAGERPPGGWPAIVFVHGYIPPTQYTTQGQYADYIDYLARRGFVVFKIDLRGHAQSEGEPSGAYYSSDYVIDTLNARAALMRSDFVNPKQVGLWGHSMAGNVTLRSLAVQPDIPAVAIWGGAVFTYADRLEYGIQDGSYIPPAQSTARQSQRLRLRNAYGEFDRNHWFWKQVAPTNYLTEIKGAISLHHAVNDDVVNIGYSRGLSMLLDKTAVRHTLNEYPNGDHNIANPSFDQAMQDTVNFYRSYLAQ